MYVCENEKKKEVSSIYSPLPIPPLDGGRRPPPRMYFINKFETRIHTIQGIKYNNVIQQYNNNTIWWWW